MESEHHRELYQKTEKPGKNADILGKILLFSAASALCGAIATGILRGRSVYDITFISADTSISSGTLIAGGMTLLAFTIFSLSLILRNESSGKTFYTKEDIKERNSNFMKKFIWLSFTPFVIVPYAANVTLATAVTLVASSVLGSAVILFIL